MLHLDFTGPHYPYIVPEPFASAVRVEDLPPWPNLAVRDEPERVTLWRRWFGVEDLGWDTWAKALQYNLGYIAQIDYEVGRVLNSLDTLGMADNTLVIYMSDHGEMVGERGLLDKGPGSYDALYRVPLIMRLPGLIKAGTVCDSLVQSVDIFPTLMEMANITVEQELDGWSILSTLSGNEPRESVFCQYHAAGWGETPLRIIRTREWKYGYSAGDKGELYNLIDDPAETRNLIGAPHVNDVTKQLQIELLQWMEKSKDPMFAGARIILK
jgi:arylsulfatase A-like enzyme